VFIREKIALCILIILIVLPIIVYFYFKSQWIAQPLEIGVQVPSVKIETLDGEEVFTCSIISKKSLLIFFSTDCLHCRKEMSELCIFFPIIKDSLNIVAISVSDMKATKDFVITYKIPFSVYLDNNGEAKRSFHVFPIPALFFIDKEQRIVQYKVGEQKREHLWLMLKGFSGFINDSLLWQL